MKKLKTNISPGYKYYHKIDKLQDCMYFNLIWPLISKFQNFTEY